MIKWNDKAVMFDTERKMKAYLKSASLLVEAEAKRKCPVDTGNLASSLTHEVVYNDLTAFVGTDVEYGYYQEYGTRYMAPRAFLRGGLAKLERDNNKLIKKIEGLK